MASITWPAELPQSIPVLSRESSDDNVIETPMDGGVAKLRARFSAVSRFLFPDPQRFLFTRAQKDALLLFFDVTAVSGTQRFDWLDPVPEMGLVEVRFFVHGGGIRRPDIALARPSSFSGAALYRVQAAFEVLP